MTPRILVYDVEKPCLDHGFRGNGQGYASVRLGEYQPIARQRKKVLLHRVIFEREHGFLPPVVMHICDNPRCIEPSHLRAGDWDLNNKDRAAKGRSARFRYDKRTLSDAAVIAIRRRYSGRGNRDLVNGVTALAREFGVDANVIYQITDGRTYQNVA